jgi:hypothetical protein
MRHPAPYVSLCTPGRDCDSVASTGHKRSNSDHRLEPPLFFACYLHLEPALAPFRAPLKEIAAETGVSVNTLLSRKRYAVLRLRELLQSIYDEFTKA